MTNEGRQQAPPARDLVEACFGGLRQGIRATDKQVRELVVFCVAPTSLDGVCVWGIRREMEGLDSLGSGQEFSYGISSVDAGSVPDQEQGSRNPAPDAAKEFYDPLSIEVLTLRQELEQEVWALGSAAERDCSDYGEFSTPIPGMKQRGSPAGCESPLPKRKHLEAGLVEKDQRRLFLDGFFLMSGSSVRTHWATASGFRSRATFSGFWKENPIFRVRMRST